MQEKELEIMGGSLYYTIEKNKVKITRFHGMTAKVIVPEEIEGLPVVELEKKCFMGKRNLTQVILPDTLDTVGDFCFAGDANLKLVSFPKRPIAIGKTLFWNCPGLKQVVIRETAGQEMHTAQSAQTSQAATISPESPGELMALALVEFGSYYLLDMMDAGSDEWYRKWDAKLLTELHTSDMEGHTNEVLCGEEDYERISPEGFMSAKRARKAKLCLNRLLFSEKLEEPLREELEAYLKDYTKGAESDEAWRVVLKEYGDSKPYYELFAEIGCVTTENLDGILADIGEKHPEMTGYFLRFRADSLGGEEDFFAGLEL